MKLCTDLRTLAGPATGVASYAAALARAQATLAGLRLLLAERRGDDGAPARTLRRAAAAWPGRRRAAQREDGRLDAGDLFRLAQIHFDIWRRPLAIEAAGAPGIMHWSYPVPMRLRGWRNLYTVHDAIPLRRPDLTPIDPRRHRRLLMALAERADGFVTVSANAQAEIEAAIGCPPGFVVDCGQAIDPPAAPGPPPAGLAAGGYLLACGTVERRKNVARIARAYRAAGLAIPLVVAGPPGWGGEEAERAVAATPGALRLPYLTRAEIEALIAHARALLMPSLAEGFGLPIVEAMVHGTPVLTSRGGATEEAADGAALLTDPTDAAAMATAIARIVGDDALRARLAAAGRRRAADFTPARFAARLGAVYARFAP